jgi:DnaJ-class molecular chaperone
MFKDYYAILEIEPPVSEQEIKSAYRKQCIKWHPDKNPDRDTTVIMQNIIEAYIFLKDEEGRKRYDQTYSQFRKDKKESKEKEYSNENPKEENTQKQYEYEFEFSDEVLKKWMSNAKEQAKKMKADVIDEFKGATVESGKSIANYFLYIFLPMLVGFLLIKACNS